MGDRLGDPVRCVADHAGRAVPVRAMSERTPFPEISTTEGTGYDWLGRFMEAQASLAANALFAAFKLGQIGVAGRHDKAMARGMLDDLKTDRVDLMFAAEQLDKVIESLVANIEGNLR